MSRRFFAILIGATLFGCDWLLAAPSIRLINAYVNGARTSTLQVITESEGTIAIEAGLDFQHTRLVGAPTVNTTLFDQPFPGDNPFIDGSPPGGDAQGLVFDEADGSWIFASFLAELPAGTHDFVQFEYRDNDITPCGPLVGVLADADITFGGGAQVSADYLTGWTADCSPSDINHDGNINLLDLSILGINFGKTPALASDGDITGDGVVDLLDLGTLASEWPMREPRGAAVPEPNGLAIGLLAVGGCLSRPRVARSVGARQPLRTRNGGAS